MAAGPLVTPLCDWLAALATGASGTGIVVPTGTFHSDRFATESGAEDDPEITADRRLEVRCNGDDLAPFAGSCRRLRLSLEVRVTYRYDLDLAQVGAAAGAARTTIARNRAADDGALLREVLLHQANRGTASNGARVEKLDVGPRTVEDGDGVLVSVLPVILTASYAPSDVGAAAAGT